MLEEKITWKDLRRFILPLVVIGIPALGANIGFNYGIMELGKAIKEARIEARFPKQNNSYDEDRKKMQELLRRYYPNLEDDSKNPIIDL